MKLSLVAALVMCAVLVAGCGAGTSEQNKSADKILADAQAAAKAATAVRVVGTGSTSGVPYTLDLNLVAGTGGEGKVSEGGSGFDVIQIGDKAYFRGDATFLRALTKGCAPQLTGKWFYVAADNPKFASLAQYANLQKLTGALLTPPGELTKGTQVQAKGQPTVTLVDAANGVTLYVATTGKAYPVQLTTTTGQAGKIAKPAAIVFSGWNTPVVLTAPRNAVDLSKLTC